MVRSNMQVVCLQILEHASFLYIKRLILLLRFVTVDSEK